MDRRLVVFDVNETLLDLESMQPIFQSIFGEPSAMRLWFANLILYSDALTLADVYVPFTDIGGAVLKMLAATRGIRITDSQQADLTERFASMPPHPEVPAALRKLKAAGFRLFALTDNTLEIQGRQLKKAGIIDLFERRFSVDESVRRHKPAPQAYASVAATLGDRAVPIGRRSRTSCRARAVKIAANPRGNLLGRAVVDTRRQRAFRICGADIMRGAFIFERG